MPRLRIATFNLENLDDKETEGSPKLSERIPVLRQSLLRLRADLLCLQEVHGQERPGQPRQLLALQEVLAGTEYAGFNRSSTLTQQNQPYDVRNLVVVSRFGLGDRQQIMNRDVKPEYRPVTPVPRPSEAKPVNWERPILYVKADLGGGRVVHVINLHLKSKLPVDIAGQKLDKYTWKSSAAWAEAFFISSMKRVGQALEVRLLIESIFDQEPEAWIAVCGDFNADNDEVPVTAIRGPVEETGNPALVSRVLVPCENTIPEPSRYSLFHLGRGQMLDHILVSRPLLAHYRGSEIHNEVLPDESGAFRTDKKFPESDHAPVVATFEVP
jgi:endonuclease/exonuclease/phosphatase family metal-dependent hydrolase